MRKKNVSRMLCFLMAVILLAAIFAGCTATSGEKETTSKAASSEQTESQASTEPLLTVSFYNVTDNAPTFINESDDVIGQYITDRFNIKVGEVYYNQGMTGNERLNIMIASNQVPDVVRTIGDNVTFPATGRFAELGDMIRENCPNVLKYYPEADWKELYKGRMYLFPILTIDGSFPQFKDDLYVQPMPNWAGLWTTESLLKKLGYSFTPIADIYKKINETQTKPTFEDFQIQPAINTPEDLYNCLKKIKETIPTVDGKEMIPLEVPYFLEPHFGAMFGLTGGWKYNSDTKQVSQFLGDEKAKDYWKFFNKLYKEGLLDKDFAVQPNDAIQEKALQGRLGFSMWFPNHNDVQANIKKLDPNDSLRVIPLPVEPGVNFAGIDGASPATFRLFINKDFSDIPRLLRFLDWTTTEEAVALSSFGPEALGLYEEKDGKKVFKDEALHQALLNNDEDYLKTHYYNFGLGGNIGTGWPYSKISVLSATPLFYGVYWKRSYPYKVEAQDITVQNNFVSTKGLNWKGMIASPVDDVSKLSVDFTYGEFEQQYAAKLFAAKTDEEFEKNWNDIIKYYNEKMKYEEARNTMKLWFKTLGYDVE